MLLDTSAAGHLIDAFAALLLGTALLSILVRRLDYAILLLAAQGMVLTASAGTVALTEPSLHAAAATILTFIVKGIAIPGVLFGVLREVELKREIATVLPLRVAAPAAVGLVLVAYQAAAPLALLDAFGTRDAIPAAIVMMLLGLFTMLIRKKAVSQVIGLVSMENGVYLAAVVATHGLPLAVELGIAVDLLAGAGVMGLVMRQISRTFRTVNTDRLRMLRG